MENQFIRHEPCFERILFVLTLDRKKMKERILIGEEQQIRFRLNGSQNAEVLCDMTRPLGTFLINFERDTDRDWNLYGLSPLRQALHSNRWKQPELEQAAFDACGGSYPVRAELTMTEFPLKEYDGFALPAGEYLALRVVIGEGAGRNWWCVVYPPLCTAACTDLEDVAVQAGMDESDMKLITGQEGYVLKFRAVELWERLRQWLGK